MRLELIMLGPDEVAEGRARNVLETLSPPWEAGALGRIPLDLRRYQDEARLQVDAGRLLEALEAPRPGTVAVALTARDLFLPVLAHVIGLAPLGGHRAVVSLARLDPGIGMAERREQRLRRRLLIEVVHEAGHAVGLRHCPVPTCVMHQSLSAEELDLKAPTYCPHCLRAVSEAAPPGSPGSQGSSPAA